MLELILSDEEVDSLRRVLIEAKAYSYHFYGKWREERDTDVRVIYARLTDAVKRRELCPICKAGKELTLHPHQTITGEDSADWKE
jgi:hypothetical protein